MIAGSFTGKEFVTILAALVAPQSRGTVKIASNDTSVLPLIDPGWLTDPVDEIMAIEAFKRTREFFSAQAMQPILDGPEYLPGPSIQTDDQILDWIRSNLMTGMFLYETAALPPPHEATTRLDIGADFTLSY